MLVVSCSGEKEAKATVPLAGMRAQLTEDPKLSAKYPGSCFEVSHSRRRTYYLRPYVQKGMTLAPSQQPQQWIKFINAAIDTIGKSFDSKFKRHSN